MFSWFKTRRRSRLLSEAISLDWLGILKREVPCYSYLSIAEQSQLRDDLRIFIAEKQWVGCGGVEVTDEMRVVIAAQACLLTLNIKPTYHYDQLKSLLIYPSAFLLPVELQRERLIVDEGAVLSGEAWRRSPIILSWHDVADGARFPYDGSNVVFHEFAHHLDGLDGSTDGIPPLENRAQYESWKSLLRAEYQRLVDSVREGRRSLLRAYGATNPAEFFAVASETFFERGLEMRRQLPEMYEALRRFYRHDTAAWPQGPHPRAEYAPNGASDSDESDDGPDPNSPSAGERNSQLGSARSGGRLVKRLNLPPGSPDAHYSLGVAWLQAEEFERAVAAFTSSLELEPDDSEALRDRGIAELRLGDLDAAQIDLDAALELDRKDLAAYRARAELLIKLDEIDHAWVDLNYLLKVDRRDAVALFLRGQILLGQGDAQSAVTTLTSAIAQNPHRAEAYVWRARAYDELGDAARAERDRAESIRRDPRLADGAS